MKVVYEDYQEVTLNVPYIPGFLAFREAPHIVTLLDRMQNLRP